MCCYLRRDRREGMRYSITFPPVGEVRRRGRLCCDQVSHTSEGLFDLSAMPALFASTRRVVSHVGLGGRCLFLPSR